MMAKVFAIVGFSSKHSSAIRKNFNAQKSFLFVFALPKF
jgi:hypothetical protein